MLPRALHRFLGPALEGLRLGQGPLHVVCRWTHGRKAKMANQLMQFAFRRRQAAGEKRVPTNAPRASLAAGALRGSGAAPDGAHAAVPETSRSGTYKPQRQHQGLARAEVGDAEGSVGVSSNRSHEDRPQLKRAHAGGSARESKQARGASGVTESCPAPRAAAAAATDAATDATTATATATAANATAATTTTATVIATVTATATATAKADTKSPWFTTSRGNAGSSGSSGGGCGSTAASGGGARPGTAVGRGACSKLLGVYIERKAYKCPICLLKPGGASVVGRLRCDHAFCFVSPPNRREVGHASACCGAALSTQRSPV